MDSRSAVRSLGAGPHRRTPTERHTPSVCPTVSLLHCGQFEYDFSDARIETRAGVQALAGLLAKVLTYIAIAP